MPRRKQDPATGRPRLTPREHKLVEAYVSGPGNATRAAVDAGYSPKHAGQSAHKVLSRPEVQARIYERIAQTRITSQELMGALAQHLRADATDCFDQQGRFDLGLARQNGLGPLLKVRASTRRTRQPDGQVRAVVETSSFELESPLASALNLARTGAADFTAVYNSTDISQSVEALITSQMQKHNLPRSAVVTRLLDIRPEIAEFLVGQPLPNTGQ